MARTSIAHSAAPLKIHGLLELLAPHICPEHRQLTRNCLIIRTQSHGSGLTPGLRFNLDNPNEELSASFTKGYEGSLKKYHGMMVRPVFYVSSAVLLSLISALPTAAKGHLRMES
jgi:hypothetical protein